MTNSTAPKTTTAFFVQAGASFAVALGGMLLAEIYLPAAPWARAFMALGTLFLVTSTFTLAKVIRDAQETGNVISRLDQARLERLLAEFDPYKVPDLPPNLRAQDERLMPAAANGYPATSAGVPPMPRAV